MLDFSKKQDKTSRLLRNTQRQIQHFQIYLHVPDTFLTLEL